VAAGILLAGGAALVSSAGIERFFLGSATGALSWGPSLFRAMLAAHGLALLLAGFRYWRRPARSRVASGPRLAIPVPRPAWIALGLLAIVALALRLIKLDAPLWWDEVLTVIDYLRRPLGAIVTDFSSQNNHMLYTILAKLSIGWLGESPWVLRLPAALFGVASVFALFPLALRLCGLRAALFACALMTVSYHHVWFSQNARGYTGLLLFTLLATWLWLEARERSGWVWWIGYSLSLFFGVWIHLTMLFVAASHFLLAIPSLLRGGDDRRRPIAAWSLAATLTLQVYALSLPEFFRTALHETSLDSEWTRPVWLLRESLRGLQVGFAGAAVVAIAAAVTLLGWLKIFRRDRIAAIALVLPAALGGATVLAMGHNLWPRFFFFSMGFGLLAAVDGALEAPRLLAGEGLGRRLGTVLASLMIVVSAATVPRCYALPKQDFPGARDFVARSRASGEAAVAVGLAARAYRDYYAPDWTAAGSRAELESALGSHRSVWLVYTLPIEMKAFHPEVWNVVEREFAVVKVFPGTLGGGEVYVCQDRRSLKP
jgi:4-amino-4-deoxy-L-arabinose transferase-like glycosyltransferase